MIWLSVENVVEFIKCELNRRGWSQAKLAKNANLDSAVISNILNEKRGVGWETARSIAEAFDIPPEIMFRKAGLLPPVPAKTEQTERLLYLFNQLPQDRRDDLLDYAEFLLRK